MVFLPFFRFDAGGGRSLVCSFGGFSPFCAASANGPRLVGENSDANLLVFGGNDADFFGFVCVLSRVQVVSCIIF